MSIYSLQSLFHFVKERSPYYKNLYKQIESFRDISELPVIDQKDFWAHNTLDNNRLLTDVIEEGIVFKSGGTTGNPKFSMFTNEEWQSFTKAFGWGMSHGGIAHGDRVANLFYVGDLYASFLFIQKSLELAPLKTLNFPITGAVTSESMVEKIEEFHLSVITAAPTTIMQLSQLLLECGKVLPQIKKILFGGEALHADQFEKIHQAFPEAQIRSVGYASVDAGLLGYADASCKLQEHRPFHLETVIEIIDPDTEAVITEPGVSGKIVVTNLTRRLMPIIRYPSGDMGYWLDKVGGKFKIVGRSDEGARIGPITVYLDDLRNVVMADGRHAFISNMQTTLKHFDGKDQLVLRLVYSVAQCDLKSLGQQVVEGFYKDRPMYAQHVEENKVHPCIVEWIEHKELKTNQRTGKLILLVDERMK